METTPRTTTSNVRRKVVFVFIACITALALAWAISRLAFEEMIVTIDRVTSPNRELELVSGLSKGIMQLDQLQRSQALLDKRSHTYDNFADESQQVVATLDSLKDIYAYNPIQVQRLDSIRSLLAQRDRLFDAYINVRNQVVDVDEFTAQLQALSDVILEPAVDSTIITTSQTRRTTTYDDNQSRVDTIITPDQRGLFSRLFGSRKPEEEEREVLERRVIEDELKIFIDTIRTVPYDSVLARIDSAVQSFQLAQQLQRETFIDREVELTLAGNLLIGNMLNILSDVERDVLQKIMVDNAQAKIVIDESVVRIGIVILVCFIAIGIMIYLILGDIRKSNAYRIALEQAKNEAEYHAAAKQRFLANMSHEIRTPLQSILGYSEQIKYDSQPDPAKVDAIYHSSEHLLQIVNEILDYSRMSSGKITLNDHEFNINELVTEVISVMTALADQKGLKLAYNSRFIGSEHLFADSFRIKQILFNLLSNAVKFTQKGEIVLNVSTVVYQDKTELNIVVKDTGEGIAEKDLELIFNDFEQSEHANSGRNFGSGLGLSIVKTICESMGGTIRVESRRGHGSTFRVNIPTKTVHTPAIPKTGNIQQDIHYSAQPRKVWVIDDDPFILELCRIILQKHDIPHRCFASPLEALETPWESDVDLVLMDIRMPEMNGFQLNQELRKRIPTDKVRLCAFTAQALPEEREQIIKQGFDAILLKPFREVQLLAFLGVPQRKPVPVSPSTSEQTQINIEDTENTIRKQYICDTEKDIQTIREAYNKDDVATVELIFHRLAGRTAQMGHTKLAFVLRKMEIDSRNDGLCEPQVFDQTITEVENYIIEIENNIKAPSVSSGVS